MTNAKVYFTRSQRRLIAGALAPRERSCRENIEYHTGRTDQAIGDWSKAQMKARRLKHLKELTDELADIKTISRLIGADRL